MRPSINAKNLPLDNRAKGQAPDNRIKPQLGSEVEKFLASGGSITEPTEKSREEKFTEAREAMARNKYAGVKN